MEAGRLTAEHVVVLVVLVLLLLPVDVDLHVSVLAPGHNNAVTIQSSLYMPSLVASTGNSVDKMSVYAPSAPDKALVVAFSGIVYCEIFA